QAVHGSRRLSPRRLPQRQICNSPSSHTGRTRSLLRYRNRTSGSPPRSCTRPRSPCRSTSASGSSLSASATPPNMAPPSEAQLAVNVADVEGLRLVPVHVGQRQGSPAAQGEPPQPLVDLALDPGQRLRPRVRPVEQARLKDAGSPQPRGGHVHARRRPADYPSPPQTLLARPQQQVEAVGGGRQGSPAEPRAAVPVQQVHAQGAGLDNVEF